MRAADFKLIDTPEKFCAAVPRDLVGNVSFREALHGFLDRDTGAQAVYKAICLKQPQIAFDTAFFTLNPKKPAGMRNWPFILRESQREAVDALRWGIDNGRDVGIEKSREEGCSETILKLFTLYVLLVPETQFLCGSRTEDEVDKSGDRFTLFAKIDYAIDKLPTWWKRQVVPQLERTHLHIGFKPLSSAIDGEATSVNFGASSRATAAMLDEFGRIDTPVAEAILGSVNDITNCVIFSSTHWLGLNHPFAKALRRDTIRVVRLPWWRNPEKNKGLYLSPEPGVIEIVDLDYYRRVCPEVFNTIQPKQRLEWQKFSAELETQPFDVQDKLLQLRGDRQHLFIADGCERYPHKMRSPWYDYEQGRRSVRDFASNVNMDPGGSADSAFDHLLLSRVRDQTIRDPMHRGEIVVQYQMDGKVSGGKFQENYRANRLRWWGKLHNGRPDQSHNYVIGCDPSLGTGASNSVAEIYDCNLCEQIGEWACPNSPPAEFADTVRSLALWVGGHSEEAFVIWESNAGPGTNFCRRLLWNGQRRVYVQKTEMQRRRKKTNKYGWASGRQQKFDLITEYAIALAEGLKPQVSNYVSVAIHSSDLLSEMNDYLFTPANELVASEHVDETTGARQRHGDRVIAMGLCLVGAKDQRRAVPQPEDTKHEACFADRMAEIDKERKREKREFREFLY
jgi:hypothetical protein